MITRVYKGNYGYQVAQLKNNDFKDVDYGKIIAEKKAELYEKIKNNDTEVRIQIGAQAFTEKEWDKLLENIDEAEESIKEAMKEKQDKREENHT